MRDLRVIQREGTNVVVGTRCRDLDTQLLNNFALGPGSASAVRFGGRRTPTTTRTWSDDVCPSGLRGQGGLPSPLHQVVTDQHHVGAQAATLVESHPPVVPLREGCQDR